ncbi:unnamed protein product [Oppiella nova]|uniref:Uncharacterized protein n=1 Tax=Oppiella nova TaxID=334625 RepID=A0A7R9MD92_9ACAR|nr:unnamed protein product [Oppiella nova]CAG2175096.1 unnamed protein product [Oppiella nova]
MFASTKMFMFIFGTLGIIQGAAFTYMIASTTTLERRYAFGSKVTGLILIADNVMELTMSPVFGYLATRAHRPRMIAYCHLVVVLGCYLAALPYFIYGPGVHLLNTDVNGLVLNTSVEYCDSNRLDGRDCDGPTGASSTVVLAVLVLWLGSFCNGIGFVAFYTIGIPFIDDSVKKKNSPLYLSQCYRCGSTLWPNTWFYALILLSDIL